MREYEQEKTKKKHENIFLKMRGARLQDRNKGILQTIYPIQK